RSLVLAVLVAALVPVLAVLAQTKGPRPVTRARPPKLEKSNNFYNDAFTEGLVGQRPADLGKKPAAGGGEAAPGSARSGGSGTGGVAGSGWAALISGATIEDEIKSLKLRVDQNVTTPSDFAGKGYKLARRDFSVLAMLFAIAGEYEGDVRWKSDAPAARDAFARTANNAKVGTQQVWQEAKQRKDELTDMVGGSSPFSGKNAEAKATWKDVCGRAPLMQHLESVWEPKLKPLLADKGQFTANSEEVVRHAEMIAAIGHVLEKEGMPDADSEEYVKFGRSLRDGAKAIVEAAKSKNFDQATGGGTAIGKSCTECHENYKA
ncbi:MAG TPA: hypothetical protein VFV87_04005, partial [Pirellulaceae bacterium]|nr:hypothetical protein [Pirellulaceae bacterium]